MSSNYLSWKRRISLQGFVSFLVLLSVVTPCSADVIILKNGKKYRGELNNRNIIHLNPLSVEKITILLEKAGPKESKLVTFDASDVDKIILETFEAREIIDLASLRQMQFTGTENEDSDINGSRPGGALDPQAQAKSIEIDKPLNNNEIQANKTWSSRMKTGIALTGGGALILGVGAVVGFGDNNDLNAANYFLIGMGTALMGYGIFKIVEVRSRHAEHNVQLGVDPGGTVGISFQWRF